MVRGIVERSLHISLTCYSADSRARYRVMRRWSVGSRTAGSESDIDMMINYRAAGLDVYYDAGLKEYAASLFPGPVDVVNRAGLEPFVGPPAQAEAVYAF